MKSLLISALLLSLLLLTFCTSSKKIVSTPVAELPDIRYQKDIMPIMQAHCTPCHFPERGRKKMLDTYAAVKENIDDIIYRVGLPTDHEKFMPFKSKKQPLTDSLILVFKQWQQLKMPE